MVVRGDIAVFGINHKAAADGIACRVAVCDIDGAILLTPADGFKVDFVLGLINGTPQLPEIIPSEGHIKLEDSTAEAAPPIKKIVGYKVYWKASDGEKARSNMWKVGD